MQTEFPEILTVTLPNGESVRITAELWPTVPFRRPDGTMFTQITIDTSELNDALNKIAMDTMTVTDIDNAIPDMESFLELPEFQQDLIREETRRRIQDRDAIRSVLGCPDEGREEYPI